MKSKVMLISFLFIIFASYFAAFAFAEVKVCEEGDDNCKIDNAYSCLNDEIDAKTCSRLGSDEKVFSLITAGECKSEVESDSKFKSDIRYTSLAVLGGATGKNSQEWLISKNRTTTNLDWFLQIESPSATSCTVSYGSPIKLYTVQVSDDKTLSGSLSGSCFSPSSGNYWLKVSSNCFDTDIKVKCDKSFLTSLLYQRQGSSTIYVSDETHSSSAGGETTENVQSLCFGPSGSCDYGGSLWASLVLNSKNHDMAPYLPYLITNMEDNEKLLPEAFLYLLSGDFGNELLSKQIADKWWLADSANDRFYDTALALYSSQYDDSSQRQNSVRWLLDEAQGADGCWNNGDIRDTAFILYSIEPRTSAGAPIDDNVDCESSGFSCMSGISCSQAGGNPLNSYICSGTFVCCDKAKVYPTCLAQGGELCSSTQRCSGGNLGQASDSTSSQVCCVGGTCEVKDDTPQVSECVSAGGECRVGSCSTGETESFQSCDFSSDICCIQKSSGNVSTLWIWILLLLITLVALGIIFREKLKHLWFRVKHKFFSGGSAMSNFGGRPSPPSPPLFTRSPFQQRAPQRPMSRPATSSRPRGELDEVLKKLKEMGK
ncbi:MAG: hypothetical protein AABX93_01390 [Nanoarchaeota archaeon]